jgi:hypothetical protein
VQANRSVKGAAVPMPPNPKASNESLEQHCRTGSTSYSLHPVETSVDMVGCDEQDTQRMNREYIADDTTKYQSVNRR